MINNIHQHRKLIAVILLVSSALIIGPIVAPEDNVIIATFGSLIMIQNIIVSGILFFKGVVSAAMVLTYSIIFMTSIAFGLVLKFNLILPESMDQSGLTTGAAVVFFLALTMMFPLHKKVGNWVNSKLDPNYRTPERPRHFLADKPVNPYVHILYSRNSNIFSNKPYAIENTSPLNRKLRTMSAIIGAVLCVLILVFTVYVDIVWKYYGDIGVYLSICLAFIFVIMGVSFMFVGFIRSWITLVFCLIIAVVLGLCIMLLDWISRVSQIGFIVGFLGLCSIAGYLFARFIIKVDIKSTRNVHLIYEKDGQVVAFSEPISRQLPLKDFENLIRLSLNCPNDSKSKTFIKLTDRIRAYCMRHGILFVGWKWSPNDQIAEFVFYAQQDLIVEKFRKFIRRRISGKAQFIHEKDPSTQYYHDNLVPYSEKMIEVLNEVEFHQLALREFDFTQTYEVRFACFIEDPDAQKEFTEIAKQMGYGESIQGDLYIIMTKNLQIEINQMNQICKKFSQLANLYGGTFEGWSL